MKASYSQFMFLGSFLAALFIGSLLITNIFIGPILFFPELYIQISGFIILGLFICTAAYALYLRRKKNTGGREFSKKGKIGAMKNLAIWIKDFLGFSILIFAGLAILFILFRINLSFY